MLDALTSWKFLNEPLWRWAIFILALIFILWAWRGVLNVARDVVE